MWSSWRWLLAQYKIQVNVGDLLVIYDRVLRSAEGTCCCCACVNVVYLRFANSRRIVGFVMRLSSYWTGYFNRAIHTQELINEVTRTNLLLSKTIERVVDFQQSCIQLVLSIVVQHQPQNGLKVATCRCGGQRSISCISQSVNNYS